MATENRLIPGLILLVLAINPKKHPTYFLQEQPLKATMTLTETY